jgi:hypothetical protein
MSASNQGIDVSAVLVLLLPRSQAAQQVVRVKGPQAHLILLPIKHADLVARALHPGQM